MFHVKHFWKTIILSEHPVKFMDCSIIKAGYPRRRTKHRGRRIESNVNHNVSRETFGVIPFNRNIKKL